jgi:endonuclease/exonuclease/phosphatase family metal-dependent hydrolase
MLKYFLLFLLIYPSLSISQDKISIASWNTYLLPKTIKKSNQKNRSKDISSSLINHNYDIIALQEVFDKASLKSIIDSLAKKYRYYKVANKNSLFKTSSGLIVFSKYEITNTSFIKYKRAISADYFAKKGALICKIKINDSIFINVVNTHLQSTNKEKAKKIRQSQLNQIQKAFTTDSIIPTVFLGDFNIPKKNNPNYKAMLSILNANDSSSISQIFTTCNSLSNNLVKSNEPPAILDYILNYKSPKLKVIDRKYIEEKDENGICLSDHNLVEALIILK